ncbi:sensor histidine kinase [Niabella drilacis]|uniref:histidine kinase n=1 Tax=Niabella drilacis (strain DSM 25811 / CCM 8410 / CCUG 62505 / LMG 26954 / E90) TaxID=1285928 RepID=A0A1G6RCE4_NIADE|nr:PAS domain S-box protein [Niabella drilacis]SDD02218.1 PAS domain-containing protein [Niabella drilacis]
MNKDTGIGFDVLFTNASLGIMVANEQGTIVLANPFLLKQFGYSEKELLGQKIEKLIPERYHKRHVTHVHHYNEHPKNRPMGLGLDLYATRKNGTEFPVEVSLGSYPTEQGKHVIAFLNDISKRKEAEQALQQLNEALEQKVEERTVTLKSTVKQLAALIAETEAKDTELNRINIFLKNIWNHAAAIIIVTDNAGIINMINPAAERLLLYSSNELITKETPTIFLNEAEISFASLVDKAGSRTSNEVEVYYKRKDDSQFPVSQTFTAMRNAQGVIEGYLMIAMDISKRKKAETDLLVALQKEKELSELKSRFVSIASHEFRTPLSTVLSSAYLISKYAEKEDQHRRDKHIQRIVSAVNMLTDILNDFLSVGKIEEGKIQLRKTVFDIKQHLQQITNELHGLLKKDQQIHYRHEGVLEIELDPSLVKHILLNLLSNAIKFSPEGSVIELRSVRTPEHLKISVADQGIGISQDDQLHLFERFFRAANATNIQGTGLGLHIVSKYVELLNGTITCNSRLDTGTTFELNFRMDP